MKSFLIRTMIGWTIGVLSFAALLCTGTEATAQMLTQKSGNAAPTAVQIGFRIDVSA